MNHMVFQEDYYYIVLILVVFDEVLNEYGLDYEINSVWVLF